MRSFLVFACLAIISGSIAIAQSPVAYVYVAENGPHNGDSFGPISVYSASSSGKLTQVKGSPFAQITGAYVVGTNGSQFLTADQNPQSSDQYLRSYSVGSNGAIGEEIAKFDLHEWCSGIQGAQLDHTGKFVYVVDQDACADAIQTFAVGKTGDLTFLGTTNSMPNYALPTIAGSGKFAYAWNNVSDTACPNEVFQGFARESSGTLDQIDSTETGPTPPAGDQAYQYFPGLATDDPTDHLAAIVYFSDNGNCEQTAPQLASYTVQSNGNLVSTNTWKDMPTLAGNSPAGILPSSDREIVLNPAGNILAVAVGTGIQFFHFNGAAPITKFTGVIGESGFIATMAWDRDNHLYALNGASGKLHVYSASSSKVEEVSSSPYQLPYCGAYNGVPLCTPYLVVRSTP